MATPKVYVKQAQSTTWVDVAGAAASVAGVTWQNIGGVRFRIAFTTSAPAEGSTDAYHVLQPGEAYYDKNGSAHVWVVAPHGDAIISATAD